MTASDDLPSDFAAVLVAQMPDAVVYSDAGGKIRFWNAGAERVFGFTTAEALGASLDLIIPENLRKRHWDGYDHTMHTGQTRYGDGQLLAVPAVHKDGSRLSVEFTIVPFRDSAGAMRGVAAVMRDATTRFNEMRSLRQKLAALEAGGKA